MNENIYDDENFWDVVIIGSGMGGGVAGYELTRKGHKVLFIERGLEAPASNVGGPEPELETDRLARGLWPERIKMKVSGVQSQIFPVAGCAVGGSTKLYAAALERFEISDFEPSSKFPHPAGHWPVSYADFSPYYQKAEELLAVIGTRDPLSEMESPDLPRPPAASLVDSIFMRDFARAGLHPYRLHVGIAYVPGCDECLGRICPRECKSDSQTKCVAPAIASGKAELRTESEVIQIESSGRKATGVIYRNKNNLHRVRGRIIVLSAGALQSAALLLLSKNLDHPNGLANSSDQVGRNLMFHTTDWLALWPSTKASSDGPRKTIALRDFYRVKNIRLGSFQSTGLTAGYGNVLVFLYQWFDSSKWRWIKPIRPFLRLPAKIASILFGNASIFALTIEDYPYPENRVTVDFNYHNSINVHYSISEELINRAKNARDCINKALRGHKRYWLHSDVTMNYGHSCGTCRFGNDPTTSVLNEECRTHDIDNLFVVDGSFMPSSAGANPSLTIAANAMRVAKSIDYYLKNPIQK